MKVWIVGAGGQMGRSLIDVCQALGIPFLASRRQDVCVTNLEKLKVAAAKSRCSHIINCAAFTDVDGAETKSLEAYAVNALGAENLAILAREFGMKLVHVSTDYIFDGEKESPYMEEDKPNPLNVYGKSKWDGEERVLAELPTACIVRTSWIFGHVGKNFISSALDLLKGKEHLQAVEDQINRATYNRDLAFALLDLTCHSGVYHFANHDELSRFQILNDFHEEALKRRIPIQCQKISPVSYEEFPSASPRPNYSVLNTDKVELLLGRKPRSWKAVLSEYLDYVTTTR